MLSKKDYDAMMFDRFFWLLERVGEKEHQAFNDVFDMNCVKLPILIRCAIAREANVHVVLAMFGWLPASPKGGPPFVHVCNPEMAITEAYVLDDAHGAAYTFFEDMVRGWSKKEWRAYPQVSHAKPAAE